MSWRGEDLALLGTLLPVLLRDPAALEAGIEHALRVARLLAAVNPEGDHRVLRRPWSPTMTLPIRAHLACPGESHTRNGPAG